MIVKIIQILIRFVFLLAVQVLVLNHVQWSGYINPYVYVFFILMLPIETPNWLLLISAFIIGLLVDMFANTGGMHAAACVFTAFARPGVLGLIAPRDGYEPETDLSPQAMGLKWFVTYVSILIFLHHLVFFYVEVFRFSEFFITFYKAILNSIITILLIVLGQYLFGRSLKRHERIVR